MSRVDLLFAKLWFDVEIRTTTKSVVQMLSKVDWRFSGLSLCEAFSLPPRAINPKTREEEKKRLCDIASSHLARRTFIGNLYKETPDPNIIGKLSGHKEGNRAFARYRDIDDDMLTDLVSKLN